MTATLLLAIAAAQVPLVSEIPVPDADQIVVCSVSRVPETMSARQEAALQLLALALRDGSTELSRTRTVALASQTGRGLETEAWPGALVVRFSVPRGQLAIAGLLTEGLIERAALTDSAIREAITQLRSEKPTALEQALGTRVYDYSKVTPSDVRDVYNLVRSGGRTRICIGGAFEVGRGLAEIVPRLDDESSLNKPRTGLPWEAAHGPVGGIEVARIDLGTWTQVEPRQFLALVALGTGKGSSLFRAWRLRSPESYWQQALLAPTGGGYHATLVALRKVRTGEDDWAARMRSALLDDVKGYTQSDLDRALAVARECLLGQFPNSPLVSLGWEPLGQSLADRCFLQAYDPGWNPETVAEAMVNVDLEELQAEAIRLLGG
ncbi:MAG: hypothetical protein AB7F50_06650 [Fimbriimonadaceae bacterium]